VEKLNKEKLPLLIYLHGAGGRGDDIERIKASVVPLLKGLEKFIDENNYNDFQKKLSFSISKDKPINEIDDKDLDGFAFQKSNIDFKNFNFKTYGWKKYTKIERTNIDNENFINKFWEYADFEMEKMIKLLI